MVGLGAQWQGTKAGETRAADYCLERGRHPCPDRAGLKMKAEILRQRVYALAARLSGLGLEADIYALSLVELRGLYVFLQRLANG